MSQVGRQRWDGGGWPEATKGREELLAGVRRVLWIRGDSWMESEDVSLAHLGEPSLGRSLPRVYQ